MTTFKRCLRCDHLENLIRNPFNFVHQRFCTNLLLICLMTAAIRPEFMLWLFMRQWFVRITLKIILEFLTQALLLFFLFIYLYFYGIFEKFILLLQDSIQFLHVCDFFFRWIWLVELEFKSCLGALWLSMHITSYVHWVKIVDFLGYNLRLFSELIIYAVTTCCLILSPFMIQVL